MNKWYRSRWFLVVAHIAVWGAFIIIPFLLRDPGESMVGLPESVQKRLRYFNPSLDVTVAYNLLNIAFFYLNAFVLMPYLLKRKQVMAYAAVTIICFLLFLYGIYYIRITQVGAEFEVRFPNYSFINLLLFYALSVLYRFISDRNRNEASRREKETENLKTEISFLRSQVSPHFMFNVLNNIVALSRTQPALVEPSLLQLSHLMRYMLYENTEDTVTLEKELEYLESYVRLQQMRFGDDVKVELSKQGDTGGKLIEPMLLIPLVENAFKHGVGLIENPEIKIDIVVNPGNIDFNICNKFTKESAQPKEKHSGIGLQNLQRRLKLLYPGKHRLERLEKGGYYCTTLMLELR